MNTKNFTIAGVVGTIVYFMLGGLFYNVLFPNLYPQEGETSVLFIALGCVIYTFLLCLVLIKWEVGVNAKDAALKGALFGLLNALSTNFFMYSGKEVHTLNFVIDAGIGAISTAITSAVIMAVYKKLQK